MFKYFSQVSLSFAAENDPVKVIFIERMNDVNFMKEKRLR